MSEKIYDEQVAPLILEAAKICERNGIGLVAHCQWSEHDFGRTETTPHNKWPAMRIAQYGSRCRGNVDSLIWALVADGEQHGHNSLELHLRELRQKE